MHDVNCFILLQYIQSFFPIFNLLHQLFTIREKVPWEGETVIHVVKGRHEA
jgi:hypothetical protein